MNHLEPTKTGFQSFEHAAADIVLAASFNSSGTRAVLCSADHKIRVYNIDRNNDVWTLADQWRGHDAEVLDVQWISSSFGQFFATIGGDNKFKLWREDPSQLFKSGRRFKCIYSQSPPNHVSYVSFGSKTIKHEIWLAMVTHDGFLNLLEAPDPESLSSWSPIASILPFGRHPRGTEAKFRMSFHQSEGPSSHAVLAGVDPGAISIAVSALKSIKVYRAIKPSDFPESNYQFCEMVEMRTDTTSINEIAWAPGCLHPCDVIAAACEDGSVRVFEIDTPRDLDGPPKGLTEKQSHSNENGLRKIAPSAIRNAPSGIGAGLAGISRHEAAARSDERNDLNIAHEWKEVAVLPHNDGSPVWKVRWTHDGSALASTGDSGIVHLWRESLSGGYVEFAETEPA